MVETPDSIAIVGMAARLPGARDLEHFWKNMLNGVESISTFSDSELMANGVPTSLVRNPRYVKARGILSDIEHFDAEFFGLTPMDAALTDPQHRLLMECAWEALESAGWAPECYAGTIGVYAGTAISSYWLSILSTQPELRHSADTLRMLIANDKDHVNTKISYRLNLKGPSINVNTECSSSLVAVHLACQGLLNYECDMALAGGVCVSVPQKCGYLQEDGGIGSADGHCRAFDAESSGTVPGNGAGLVLLKRLSAALADRDYIHAVIRGSAINNDGNAKVGYTAPSIDGQAAVIAKALAVAEIDPGDVDYIEAHGTGTALGDPIEIKALTKAFTKRRRNGSCRIGTVKHNIGHLGAAAGIAGLIEAVLAIKHRRIPPLLHFKQLNSHIDIIGTPFRFVSTASEWEESDHPRCAGVSSFGIGGTNAHVILEEAPRRGAAPSRDTPAIVPLSAKTPTALSQMMRELALYLELNPEVRFRDVAFTLQSGRREFKHRWAAVCRDLTGAIHSLKNDIASPSATFCSLRETRMRLDNRSEGSSLVERLCTSAQEWVRGEKVEWERLDPVETGCRIPLPTYPFERQRYWIEQLGPSASVPGPNHPPLLNLIEKKPDTNLSTIDFGGLKAEFPPEECVSETGDSPSDSGSWIEQGVREIWSEVLGIREIGTSDNFFELGGDSLLVTQIIPRFRQQFEISFPISEFFDSPTIKEIAAKIAEMQIEATSQHDIDAALAEVRALSTEQLRAEILGITNTNTIAAGSDE